MCFSSWVCDMYMAAVVCFSSNKNKSIRNRLLSDNKIQSRRETYTWHHMELQHIIRGDVLPTYEVPTISKAACDNVHLFWGYFFCLASSISSLDFLTVSETAKEPPQEETGINCPTSLAMEATYINQNFSQQMLLVSTPWLAYCSSHLSVYLSICCPFLSICLSICPSICLSVRMSVSVSL